MPVKKRTVKTSKISGNNDSSPAKAKYLVGVNVSTENVDALSLLLRHLQRSGSVACIVAQNIASGNIDAFAELLGKKVRVTVVMAAGGETLAPDHVYIIPPNKIAEVKAGQLELRDPESKSGPGSIGDMLFRSIAKSYGKNAIGVVLSGAGSDVIAGVKAIKKAKGTVIAQKLDKATEKSRSSKVLRAGVADLEFDTVEIADYVNSLGKGEGDARKALKVEPQSPELRELLVMVYKATQMDTSLYKEATLMRQVEKRIRTLGLSSIGDYITYIQSYPEELNILQRCFLISVTSFFRDPGAFRALEHALRAVVANKKPGDTIRVWVPGCATGEEVYSIAILLKEIVGSRSNELDIRIFATDIDVAALEFAREGVYPQAALDHMTPVRRGRYFTRDGSSYKVCKAIREICVFSVHDVVRHPPFMRMDIISCRNLLIYFKQALQEQLFISFHYALNPDGFLLLGKSESVGPASKQFETDDARNKLFRRKHGTVSYPAQIDSKSLFIPFARQAASQSQDGMNTQYDRARDVLISQYAPPSILVSMSFDLLHFFGNAKRYLDFPKGAADFSLFSLCLPELRCEMKTLCYRITQEGTNHIVGLPTEVSIDGKPVLLRLSLRRVSVGKDSSDFAILITFEEQGSPQNSELPLNTNRADISELATQEIQRLRLELADTREHLQAVIEELEASNEALQSLNEELQSSSEELQASNEELQSSNEELTTLNDELHNKSIELVELNTTLTNIQDSIHMGLIVVDKECRVVRYNELAVRVFGLMQDDIGKHLYRVPCHLELSQLNETINDVIEIGAPVLERVQQGDYHYLMQIAPYLNEDNARTGAILTFADITSLQQAEEALRETSLKLDATVKAGRIGLWEYDIKADKTFYSQEYKSLIGFTGDEIGDSLEEWQSRVHPDDLKTTLDTVYGYMNSDKKEYEVEYRFRHKDGTYRWILVKATIVRDEKGRPVKLLGAQVDITERKCTELALAEETVRRRVLFEQASDGIVVLDNNRKVIEANLRFAEMIGYSLEEIQSMYAWNWDAIFTTKEKFLSEWPELPTVSGITETRHRRKDGSIYDVEISANPVEWAGQWQLYCVCRDITERKQTETALRESEERFRSIFYTSPDAIIISRLSDGVFVDINQSVTRLTGYTREDTIGKSSYDIHIWFDLADREELARGLTETGYYENLQFKFRRKEGTIGIGIMSAGIILLQGVPHIISITRDITSIKEAEIALAENEARLKSILHTAPVGIGLVVNRVMMDVNDMMTSMTGYSSDELIGKSARILYPSDEEYERVGKEKYAQISQTGFGSIETVWQHKNGSAIHIILSSSVIDSGDLLKGVTFAAQDITERKLAEVKLRESEERFRLTFYTSPDAIAISQIEDGRYIDVNDGFSQVTGYSREEIIGHTSIELNLWYNPDERAKLVKALSENGYCENLEITMRRKDSGISYALISAKTITLDGKTHMLSIVRDVTDLRLAEKAIKESEERFRLAFYTSPDGININRVEDGVYVDVNDSFCRITGYSREEILGKTSVSLGIWRNPEERLEFVQELEENGYSENLEAEFKCKDGSFISGLLSARIITLQGVPHVICMTRDVTEYRRAEREIKESEDRFRQAFGTSPDAICVLSHGDGTFVEVNPSFTRLTGYTREEVIGKTVLEMNLWYDQKDREEMYRRLKDDGYFENMEATFRLKGDRIDIGLLSAGIIFLKGVPHVIATIRSITDRKRAENALKESEERYRTMITALSEGVIIFNQDGRVVGCNRSAEQILRLTEAEMRSMPIGLTDWHPVHEDGSPFPIEELPLVKTLETGIAHNGVIMGNIGQDGQIAWLVVNCEPILDELTGKPYSAVVSFMDITDRFYAEQQLRKLSMAVEQSPAIIVITDANGVIQYVNPTFETVTGYSSENAIGQNPRILKSGMQAEGFYRNLWKTISSGKTWEGRLINRKKDGSLYTEETTISPLRDVSGRVVNYVAVKRDVTEHLRLNEDREKLQEQLVQAQKMESVGRLAGGVAHDFNNMLQAILGYVDMMLEDIELNEVVHNRLLEVRKASQRSADLVRQLLAFARKQPIKPKVLDLNDVISGMLKMLKPLIGEDIDLVWRPGNGLWSVKIDPSQIDQLLTNLAINARDAINGVGQITIKTKNVMFDEAYCTAHPDSVPGEYVMLEVSDNGRGIDKDTLVHIFEPFFTTKSIGEGTGLGLATVYGIVKQNDGLIDVDSELGKGTTFTIYLPKRMAHAADTEHTKTTKKIQRGTETVLIVEDEESILNICKVVLKQLGYTVLAAGTPSDAIRMANDFNGKIDLLITDIIMPQMNGRELSLQLKEMLPNMKCLYMSGYTADILASRGVPDEYENFLQKPFYMKDLAAKVSQILDEG